MPIANSGAMMSAVIATSRVARQTNRWARFAAVTVEAVPAGVDEVVIAQDVLGDEALRHEARRAAHKALRQVRADRGNHRVTVIHAVTSPVDTGVGDVYEAAARAASEALSLDPPLSIGFSDARMAAG